MEYQDFVKKHQQLSEYARHAAEQGNWRAYDNVMTALLDLQQVYDGYYRRYLQDDVHN